MTFRSQLSDDFQVTLSDRSGACALLIALRVVPSISGLCLDVGGGVPKFLLAASRMGAAQILCGVDRYILIELRKFCEKILDPKRFNTLMLVAPNVRGHSSHHFF